MIENMYHLIVADVYLSEDSYMEFEKKVDVSLSNVIKKYDIQYQFKEAHSTLKNEFDSIDGK